jgi:peptide/nickel transport system ATP-binding protein
VSGGQLQRAMTAMALCPEPDLVIFDEPTTALDVTTQIDVLAAIKEAIRIPRSPRSTSPMTWPWWRRSPTTSWCCAMARWWNWARPGRSSTPTQDYTKALVSVRGIEHTEKPPPRPAGAERDGALSGHQFRRAEERLGRPATRADPGRGGRIGSGKSTLARAITGLLPPTAGRITFAGRTLSPDLAGRSKDDLREIQMIYQMADTAMNPRQTVGTIIGRPLEFYFGLKGAERDRRVQELLDQIEMGKGFADRYPAELSGGRSSGSASPARWRPSRS